MRHFLAFIQKLQALEDEKVIVNETVNFLSLQSVNDQIWATHLLSGHQISHIKRSQLKTWVGQLKELPEWLLTESNKAVNGVERTCALILNHPDNAPSCESLTSVIESYIIPLADWDSGFQLGMIASFWQSLNPDESLLFNRLLTGNFNSPISPQTALASLAELSGLPIHVISQRYEKGWTPDLAYWETLTSKDISRQHEEDSAPRKLMPFERFQENLENLGSPESWLATRQHGGLRCQIVKRGHRVSIWSLSHELLNSSFPEISKSAESIPDGTILEGEMCEVTSKSFHGIQPRTGKSSPRYTFLVLDCLEYNKNCLSVSSAALRTSYIREHLPQLPGIQLHEELKFKDWTELEELLVTSRKRQMEGVLLRKKDSLYDSEGSSNRWLCITAPPAKIKMVLLYANLGSRDNAEASNAYTFGVWDSGQLISVAKVISGLNPLTLSDVDQWIISNTLSKKGPIRNVPAKLVFTIAFDSVHLAHSRKSGVVLKIPRIDAFHADSSALTAGTLDELKEYLP